MIGEGSLVGIDLDYFGAALFGIGHEAGCRVDGCRGTDDEDNFGGSGGVFGFLHHAIGEGLAEPDYAGPGESSAGAVRREFGQGCAAVK